MRIVLYGYSGNGFGDLVFLKRLYEALKTNETYQITVVTPKKDKETLNEIFPGELTKVIHSEEEFQQKMVGKIDLYIEGPIPTKTVDGISVAKKLGIPLATPVVLLVEYNLVNAMGFDKRYNEIMSSLNRNGYRNVMKFGTGLGPDSLGIWIDQELVAACDPDKMKENWPKYWDKLEDLGGKLLKEDEIKFPAETTDITLFYSAKSDTILDFLAFYKNLICHQKRDQVLVCIGHTPEVFEANFAKCQEMKELQTDFNFNFIRLDDQKAGVSFGQEKTKESQNLRIVYGKKITNLQMKALMVLARWLAITGDQSLSEAISSGKFFYYETVIHKAFLADVLSDLLGRQVKDAEVKKVVDFLYYHPLLYTDAGGSTPLPIMKKNRSKDGINFFDVEKLCAAVGNESIQGNISKAVCWLRSDPKNNLATNIKTLVANILEGKHESKVVCAPHPASYAPFRSVGRVQTLSGYSMSRPLGRTPLGINTAVPRPTVPQLAQAQSLEKKEEAVKAKSPLIENSFIPSSTSGKETLQDSPAKKITEEVVDKTTFN